MSEIEDQQYFAERERQSRKLAAEAADEHARAVHLQLASLYAVRARSPHSGGVAPAPAF